MQYSPRLFREVHSSDGLHKGGSLLEMHHSGVKRCICNGRYFKTGLKCVYKRPEIVIILGKPKYIRGHYRYFYDEIDFEHAKTCYRSISLYDKPNQFLRERLKRTSPREKKWLKNHCVKEHAVDINTKLQSALQRVLDINIVLGVGQFG